MGSQVGDSRNHVMSETPLPLASSSSTFEYEKFLHDCPELIPVKINQNMKCETPVEVAPNGSGSDYAKFLLDCPQLLPVNQVTDGGALEDISKLLKIGEMTDVKFEVEGQVFFAHMFILAARSLIFKTELFGSMSETKMDCIKIEDMKSEVFKALLHFAYTYSLPNNVDTDMIQHLLVAADRYAMKGLITRCEERLTKKISWSNVLGLLIYAESHKLKKLKDACLDMAASEQKNFIKLVLSKEYFMMQDVPSLFDDLIRKRILKKL